METPKHSDMAHAGPEGLAERFVALAHVLVADWPRFFPMLEPGNAKHGIVAFKLELRSRAFAEFCVDYTGKPIGNSRLSFDYMIGTVAIEVAMNLREGGCKFERGILKAIMVQDDLQPVTHLLFLAKNGAHARCNTPTRQAMMKWLEREYSIRVEVRELGPLAEGILDTRDE